MWPLNLKSIGNPIWITDALCAFILETGEERGDQWVSRSMAMNRLAMTQELFLICLVSPQNTLMTM